MKKSFIYPLLLFFTLPALSQEVQITGNKFTVSGSEIWFNGINTPWHKFVDFGRQDFEPQWWDMEFQRYAENNINLARVWIHCSGEVSPDIDQQGFVSGASDLFWQHMDHLMDVSRQHQVYVMPALFSFDITKDSYPTHQQWRSFLNDPAKIQSYIENVLIPMVQRYNDEPYLMAWEICNEPEWMFENTEHGPQPFEAVQEFHAMLAAAIHRNSDKMVTTGSAAPKWNSPIYDDWGEYEGNMFSDEALSGSINDPEAYLDFYQYHWYPWQTQWMSSPFQQTTAEYGVDDRPVIVGESEGNDVCDEYLCQTVVEMYENAYQNGFDGVCAWKTPQNDGHGTFENIAVATNAFYSNHPSLVYPNGAVDTIYVSGVNIDPDTITLGVSDQYQLSAEVFPSNATNQGVSWHSDAPGVVSIDGQGNISALAEGMANVIVITDDGGHSDTCAVTVDGDVQPREYTLTTSVTGFGSISLDPAGPVYDEGEIVTITAIADSGYEFTGWSGAITGTANPATVTMDSDKSVTATFEVVDGDICGSPQVAQLPFAKDGSGEFCYELAGTIDYINSWNMEQVEINGVDYTNQWSNSMPPAIDGKYYVYYRGNFPWSHFEAAGSSAANARTGSIEMTAGRIDKAELVNSVIYPNPSTNTFTLMTNAKEGVRKIEVFDQMGKMVLERSVKELAESDYTFGGDLPPGQYLIRVLKDGVPGVFKVIKE